MPSLLARLAARLRGRSPDAEGGGKAQGRRGGPASARQGLWGEREAERFLLGPERGDAPACRVRVLGRRVRVGRDEIDLVLEERDDRGREIVFVEVKTRSSDLFGGGLAAMDRRKRHALCRAVARYMGKMPPTPFRIDVVEVFGDASRGAPDRVLHFRNAVPLETRFVHQGLRR